jgi:hypothetical protein
MIETEVASLQLLRFRATAGQNNITWHTPALCASPAIALSRITELSNAAIATITVNITFPINTVGLLLFVEIRK